MFGTSEGRFLVEFDGVVACAASEVSGIMLDHTPFELYVGNKPNPHLGRANYKAGDVVIKQAHALNQEGSEMFAWFRNYIKGNFAEKRTMRLLVMDEEGKTPVAIHEMTNCVPKKIEEDSHNASSNNASYFKLTIQPEDIDMVFG